MLKTAEMYSHAAACSDLFQTGAAPAHRGAVNSHPRAHLQVHQPLPALLGPGVLEKAVASIYGDDHSAQGKSNVHGPTKAHHPDSSPIGSPLRALQLVYYLHRSHLADSERA